MSKRKTTSDLKKDINNVFNYDFDYLIKTYKLVNIKSKSFLKYTLEKILIESDTLFRNYINKCGELNYDESRYSEYIQYRLINKSDSNSEIYFKLVYGDEYSKHINIRNKNKSNVYDPNYIMKREGCSYNEAVTFIEKYKKDKATNLDNFVRKHGKVKGEKMFKRFQETSNIFSIKNLERKYGEEGKKILKKHKENAKKNSIFGTTYWINKYGLTYEEAVSKVSQFQLENSGVSYKAILKRCGGNKDLANVIFNNIDRDAKSYSVCLRLCEGNVDEAKLLYEVRRKQCDSISLKYLISKGYTIDESLKIQKERKSREINTKIKKGLLIPKKLTSNFKKYCKEVDYYTSKNLSLYPNFLTKVNDKISLDHKYSKFMGFKNGVEAHIIGSMYNLEYLTVSENSSKNIKSSIELDDLIIEIKNNINNFIIIK